MGEPLSSAMKGVTMSLTENVPVTSETMVPVYTY